MCLSGIGQQDSRHDRGSGDFPPTPPDGSTHQYENVGKQSVATPIVKGTGAIKVYKPKQDIKTMLFSTPLKNDGRYKPPRIAPAPLIAFRSRCVVDPNQSPNFIKMGGARGSGQYHHPLL
ncbi:hypothetical protein CGGC5_v014754 [Colletotrichum fructicola Nara gc5]|uniref:Uncharacterized protein n=1 Tax=Colletotrichum fructicola (strain Nara gc5) TaxID=1213859 RepID=A0A7J6IJH9_COLFN|nr:hypothetical protein CGGC5_v014754 [Colletotrichum fructicola Nara gc5]